MARTSENKKLISKLITEITGFDVCSPLFVKLCWVAQVLLLYTYLLNFEFIAYMLPSQNLAKKLQLSLVKMRIIESKLVSGSIQKSQVKVKPSQAIIFNFVCPRQRETAYSQLTPRFSKKTTKGRVRSGSCNLSFLPQMR